MSSNVTPAAVPANGAPPSIAVAPTQVLGVTQGQVLAARVIAAAEGQVELAVAGGVLTAASDLPMEPGSTVRLQVAQTAADRVTLRVMPEPPPGAATPAAAGAPVPVPASPAAALAQAGVPSSAAGALLAALADAGVDVAPGAPASALAGRAAAADVSTTAQAAAFVRLEAAGLPATRASVAGLAQLIEGAPLGRTLTAIADALNARAAQPAQMSAALRSEPPTIATPLPQGDPGVESPSIIPQRSMNQPPASAPAAASPASTAATAASVGSPATGTPEASLKALASALATVTGDVAEGATEGTGQALRRALADLGVNIEHRLHAGETPDRAPLRALLHAVADHPAVDASLARAASGAADGIAAQALAGAALPAASAAGQGTQAAAADPSAQNGAYLQLPLPGGGTAEVRVHPDGGGDGREGGDRPRKVAFLLQLSALGPVMIEATAGPAGVDATVRTTGEAARAFLGERAGELSDSLRRTSRAASVSVERMSGPPPERLLEPPPASGLDISA